MKTGSYNSVAEAGGADPVSWSQHPLENETPKEKHGEEYRQIAKEFVEKQILPELVEVRGVKCVVGVGDIYEPNSQISAELWYSTPMRLLVITEENGNDSLTGIKEAMERMQESLKTPTGEIHTPIHASVIRYRLAKDGKVLQDSRQIESNGKHPLNVQIEIVSARAIIEELVGYAQIDRTVSLELSSYERPDSDSLVKKHGDASGLEELKKAREEAFQQADKLLASIPVGPLVNEGKILWPADAAKEAEENTTPYEDRQPVNVLRHLIYQHMNIGQKLHDNAEAV